MKSARTPALLAGLVLAGSAIAARHWLEASMARHMLLQIPMLLAAGSALATGVGRGPALAGRLRQWDENGVSGLSALLLAIAYWMIPRTLDGAAEFLGADIGKFAVLLLAGGLLPGALTRANTVIQLFFIGNFAWMSAAAGMLYQNSPQRLCNLYLFDDQVYAGMGLVALAVAVPLLWGVGHIRRASRGPCMDGRPGLSH